MIIKQINVGQAVIPRPKQTSSTTGLVYFGARYYNPLVGRWLTQDPAGMIDGPNRYLYCLNNPINWIDPLGLCGEKEPWWGRVSEWREENITIDKLAEWTEAMTPLPPVKIGLIAGLTGAKWIPKGGQIILGRFRGYMPKLMEFARRYHARLLNDPFPNGISLEQGLRAEIDAAKKIYFRMRGVKPGTVSHDIELKYI